MRGSKVLSWVVLGALTLGIVLMLSLVMYRQGVTAQESRRQQADIVALQAGLDEANARLEVQGEPPVPVPKVETGTTGTVEPVMPVAPSQAQILAAFDIWCDLRTCHGADGTDGDDAPAMTQAEIYVGFSKWCSTDPRCVGAPGVDGADGTDGADSTTPGPPGRPPTTAEVLAAVKVVCADGACVGAAGRDGADGADGARGVGIAKVECHTTGDWIFTMTDGTAQTVTGPCRVTPSPTPTTTKTR